MTPANTDSKPASSHEASAQASGKCEAAGRVFDDVYGQGLPPVAKLHQPSVWSLALWLWLADALWALQAGFRVTIASLVGYAIPVAAVMAPLPFRKLRARPRLREALLTIGGLLAFAPACLLLSYLVIALAPPMIDNRLAAIDAALGFHWVETMQWVNAHAWIDHLFWWCYRSAALQIIVLVVVLAATGRHRQLREFNALFMIGGIVCTLASAVTPAYGPWHAAPAGLYDIGMVSHYEWLRSGSLRLIDLGLVQGLVSMPSFHAMSAVFLAYSMRGVRGWAPLFLLLNLLMVASTLTEGGHYLIDVLAGCGLALAMIALSRSELFFSIKDDPHGNAGVAAR